MTIREKLEKIHKDINDSANLLPSPLAQPLWLVANDIQEILADLNASQRAWKRTDRSLPQEDPMMGYPPGTLFFRLVPDGVQE